MALLRTSLVVWFCCVLCINGATLNNFQEDAYNAYRPYIEHLLDNLNSRPDRFYNYNYETFINAHKEVGIPINIPKVL